jgi:hypothetical protein
MLKTSHYGIAVYADAVGFAPAIDVHAGVRSRTIETAGVGVDARMQIRSSLGSDNFQTLQFGDWLPFAAPELHISKNVQDYVLVPVIAMPSDLPNRNGVAFPLKELKAWRTEDGMLAYQTFRGKPVHVEHQNDDPTKAVGIIVDTAMLPMRGFGGGKLWKLLLLLAIDRSKDPITASKVLTGETNSYSMGAWVEAYSCGYCSAPAGACNHINLKRPRDFYLIGNDLVYRRVHGIKGFECSVVSDPAFMTAISDNLMPLG